MRHSPENVRDDEELTNLEQLLDRLGAAADDGESVSIGELLGLVGSRSFGPVLLLAGLITLAPIIGDIPGVPTIMGIFVFLLAVQLLIGRGQFWLPRWLRNRSIASEKLRKGLKPMRKPARFIDRWLRPRLTVFATGPAIYLTAIACLIISLALPVMEVIPFSANAAGAALTAFGLALIARDGLLGLIAFIFTGLTIWLVVYNLV